MPSYRHHDYGNLYIQFDVKFPDVLKSELTELHKKTLRDLLGPPREQAIPNEDAMVDEFNLEPVDAGNQRRAHGAAALDEDDEDGVPHGAERMQCASQ